MDLRDFSLRLSQLRGSKGVSARDMSLSIGQNPGYINNIENGKSKPSLDGILFICDYLGVTPSEFFDLDSAQPCKAKQLYDIAKHMKSEELDHLIAIAQAITK